MHWVSILTALTLAAISAGLVFISGWQPWEAFGAVGLAAGLLIGAAMVGLLAMTPRRDWHPLRQDILRTMRNDLRDLINWMRFKR